MRFLLRVTKDGNSHRLMLLPYVMTGALLYTAVVSTLLVMRLLDILVQDDSILVN